MMLKKILKQESNGSVPVGLHVDDFDAQHSTVEDEMSCLIKDDVGQADSIHLLQLPLHSHPASEFHVGKLLSHLLQLCKHLQERDRKRSQVI